MVVWEAMHERRVRLLRISSKQATTCVHGRRTAVHASVLLIAF